MHLPEFIVSKILGYRQEFIDADTRKYRDEEGPFWFSTKGGTWLRLAFKHDYDWIRLMYSIRSHYRKLKY